MAPKESEVKKKLTKTELKELANEIHSMQVEEKKLKEIRDQKKILNQMHKRFKKDSENNDFLRLYDKLSVVYYFQNNSPIKDDFNKEYKLLEKKVKEFNKSWCSKFLKIDLEEYEKILDDKHKERGIFNDIIQESGDESSQEENDE